MKSNTTRKVISIVLAIFMIFLGIWLIMSLFPQRQTTPDYLEFLEQVENGEIEAVYIEGGYTMRVLTTESVEQGASIDRFPSYYTYALNIPSRTQATADIQAAVEAARNSGNEALANYQVNVTFDNPSQGSIWDYLFPLLMLVYQYISMHTVYREGWGRTAVKCILVYGLFLLFASAVAIVLIVWLVMKAMGVI